MDPEFRPISVVLADDHTILREGLKMLLAHEPDIEIVGDAAEGRGAVALVREKSPAVVVMDVAMPDLNGIEATRQILAEQPKTRVIALSMHSDRRYVVEMLKAGATGYLLKDCACDELARAIRIVANRQTYLSPSISDAVVRDYLQRLVGVASEPGSLLSPREREVLQLLAEGNGTRDIANGLHVSVKTIESHRAQIMKKLDLHSIAELTKYAVREGLTSLES